MDELIRKQDALDAVSKALDRQTLLYGFVRKVALDAIKIVPPVRQDFDLAEKMDKAYDYGYEAGYLQAKNEIKPKNGTLIIPLNESDFKSVKRIVLDNKPLCRMFYEDAPGEAHWIKKYTQDDGEIYECDNCGVAWAFNDGGPEENEAFYCPKCGFKMEKGEAE